jgi:anti-sigma-K factor RskA
MTPDHLEVENLVAAYVLDACDPDEAAAARAHLEACAGCRELAGRLSRAVAALPLATEEVRPPARLRERILAEAAASPRTAAARPARPWPRRILPRPRPRGRSSRPRLRLSWSAAAIAVLVLGLLGLGGWNAYLYRTLNQPPAHYTLAGTGSMAGSEGRVTAFERQGITLVDFQGLPQPPEGRVYELWLIDAGGKAAPAGVFTPDAQGRYQLLVTRNLDGVSALAVTQEQGPDGTSQPTQQPQLAGRTA